MSIGYFKGIPYGRSLVLTIIPYNLVYYIMEYHQESEQLRLQLLSNEILVLKGITQANFEDYLLWLTQQSNKQGTLDGAFN